MKIIYTTQGATTEARYQFLKENGVDIEIVKNDPMLENTIRNIRNNVRKIKNRQYYI